MKLYPLLLILACLLSPLPVLSCEQEVIEVTDEDLALDIWLERLEDGWIPIVIIEEDDDDD